MIGFFRDRGFDAKKGIALGGQKCNDLLAQLFTMLRGRACGEVRRQEPESDSVQSEARRAICRSGAAWPGDLLPPGFAECRRTGIGAGYRDDGEMEKFEKINHGLSFIITV